MRGIVFGLGKAQIDGSATYIRGDSVEADIIRPVAGDDWGVCWVQIDGDIDESGSRVTRIRRLEKTIS